VPDFVVELLSPSDTLAKTKRKMETWISNGVELGWLVDPYKKQVLVCEPGKPLSTESGDFVEGTGPVHGLRPDLNEIWQRYEREE
jgi:Uma2 family endonuclease